jgi:hypothetical protein
MVAAWRIAAKMEGGDDAWMVTLVGDCGGLDLGLPYYLYRIALEYRHSIFYAGDGRSLLFSGRWWASGETTNMDMNNVVCTVLVH